jgi:LysR family transcriptional regulator, hydrogen peroxide-inducible genes activator
MPTLRRLTYLIAISEQRNFHRAALSAHVSQPTLSQQIKLLEEELGVVLVDRGLTDCDLTPIGRDVAERARRILREVDDLKRSARVASGGAAGHLRLGVSPTIGPYLLPEIVAELQAEVPGLRLRIREGFPGEQVRMLADGAIDLLLSPLPIVTTGLHVEHLFREPLRIVAALDHPLARRRKLEASDLEGSGVLSLDLRHHLADQVADISAALKMTLLSDYEGTSLDSIYQMAASGRGLTVLPDCYLRSSAGAAGGIRILNIRGYEMSREIAMLWRPEAPFRDTCMLIAGRVRARGIEILRGEAKQ